MIGPNGTRATGVRPIIYSFGIDKKWHFDDALASHGLDVHSFDPTTKTRSDHLQHKVQGVHFHYWGLSTSRKECRAGQPTTSYGSLGGEMLGLSQILQRLNHGAAHISALKIEYASADERLRQSYKPSLHTRLIALTLPVSPQL